MDLILLQSYSEKKATEISTAYQGKESPSKQKVALNICIETTVGKHYYLMMWDLKKFHNARFSSQLAREFKTCSSVVSKVFLKTC